MIVNQVLDELGISLDHELADITPGLDKPHIAESSGVKVHVCKCWVFRPSAKINRLTTDKN